MSNKAELWDRVQKTDPKYTKQFNRGGGFRGTATNATYLAKRATEEFGPCGIGWGVNVLDEQIIEGHPLFDKDGNLLGHHKVHKVHIRFWYKQGDELGAIEHFGQTDLCGQRNDGKLYTDEEAPKKSLTDAMSKCLSLLGFAADIHLGLFDDNKYVNDVRREFAEQPDGDAPPQPRNGSRRDGGPKLTIAQHTEAMQNAKTVAELKKAFALAWKQYENPADPKDKTPTQLTFKGTYDARMIEIEMASEPPPAEQDKAEKDWNAERAASSAATSRLRRNRSE